MDEEKDLMKQTIALSSMLTDITKKKNKDNTILRILFIISVTVNILLACILLNGATVITETTDSYNETVTQETSGENAAIINDEGTQNISSDTYNYN